MTKSTANLETFDFLELLALLAGQGKTGVLQVQRRDGTFQAWLGGGRVRHLQFGPERETAALTRLLLDPAGRFQFDEGLTHPDPGLDVSLDEVALEALRALPLPELPFGGPARLTAPERVAGVRWSLWEQDLLRQIEASRPLADLARDPEARRLIAGLSRLGLIAPRRVRVARLTVTVTRGVTGVAALDDLIYRRWREDLVRHFSHVAVRDGGGAVTSLPVRGGGSLGTQLLLPADLLLRTPLRAGDSVLVRPV